ncbi:MAG: threonine ammonia-lyase [Acidimicrobiales bacterium]
MTIDPEPDRDNRGDTTLPVTLADVESAARRIEGQVVRTPSTRSETLSNVLGADVVVKFENLQFTGSYKDRGALNRLLNLTDEERAGGVVAASAGNHAQAVAHHARRLGVAATIVMPEATPFLKVKRTRDLGAAVELKGETVGDSMDHAHLLAEAGLTFVHPFDDPFVIAGAGTVGLELLTDHPALDILAVPVGGGGLISGVSIAARRLRPDIEIIGVQTETYPSMVSALAEGESHCPGGPTMAEGIAVPVAGRLTRRIVAALVDDVVTVSESAIEDGVNLFLEIEKVVSEGAGAAGLAALLEHSDRFAGKKVGVVLTGGNIDSRLLASVILRALVRSGRLSRLRVMVDDRPGTLARLTKVVGDAGGNIIEVIHQRVFADMPIRSTEVELVVETLDRDHAERLMEQLRSAGYRVGLVPLDREPPGAA